jgi:hypothetical protein
MTIDTSYAFNPTADEIVRQAFQMGGILGLGRRPKTDQLNDARDILTTILKAMQAKGTMLVTAERVTLTLTPGTASYSLAADTIDVEFPTTYKAPGSSTETTVERLAYANYQELTDKTVQGTPTQAYVEKTATLTVSFWPVPSAAGTWNYRRVRLIRDASNGGVTIDVTRKYLQAVVWKLAHRLALANALPLGRVQYLEGQAIAAEHEATGDDNERGDLSICLTDPYGR